MTGILGAGSNAKQATAASSLQFQTGQGRRRHPARLWRDAGRGEPPRLSGLHGDAGHAEEPKRQRLGRRQRPGQTHLQRLDHPRHLPGTVGFGLVWFDNNICPLAGLPGISSINAGADGQNPDPYWVANYENDAIGYSGTTNFTADNYQLGYSAALPNFTVEVFAAPTAVNQNDGSPAAVITDFLTNDRYAPASRRLTLGDDLREAAVIVANPAAIWYYM
jgi:hypothetical protein